MTEYATLPQGEEVLTDWYAGAYLFTLAGKVDSIEDWEAGDAVVAFSDIGFHEPSGKSHGQLVVYVADHGIATTRGCSRSSSGVSPRGSPRR